MLSMVPCFDKLELSALVDECAAQVVADAEHAGHPHEGGVDFCSPFCACACCGHTYLAPWTLRFYEEQLVLYPEDSAEPDFGYAEVRHFLSADSAFRPPQV